MQLHADLFVNSHPRETPPGLPSLAPGELHLWRFSYGDAVSSTPSAVCRLLTADEWQAAGRLIFPDDRARFVLRRAFVRCILGAYLGTAPQRVLFGRNRWGKPMVDNRCSAGLDFNVSHTDDTVLLALTRAAALGVDIVSLHSRIDPEAMASVVLGLSERRLLAGAAPPDRKGQFLRLWCRKEACLKALGVGLAVDLTALDVSEDMIIPGDRIDRRDGDGPWPTLHLQDVSLDPAHRAALAVTAPSAMLSMEPLLVQWPIGSL
jgi:4'-phosphopantetheinyl transferase